MTKKILIILAVVVLIALPLGAQDSVFGNGNGNGNGSGNGGGNGNGNNQGTGNGNGNNHGNGDGNGNGYGNGNAPIHNILEGTPFTYSGTVVSIGPSGNGMVISTDQGNVEVQGLGPQRYWDNLELDKPDFGEAVVAYGYAVDFNGDVMNILTKVEFNGVTVELRDSETGAPLWRGNGGNGNGNGGFGYYGNGLRDDILNGTPFSVAGDVIAVGISNYSARGEGITIATDTTNITVNGLGPQRYWDSLGVTRPAVGDYVEVTGYIVDYNGNILYILMTVTIDGQTIQLREPETGLPLWRKGNSGNS
jgi:hypothetical protein